MLGTSAIVRVLLQRGRVGEDAEGVLQPVTAAGKQVLQRGRVGEDAEGGPETFAMLPRRCPLGCERGVSWARRGCGDRMKHWI